MLKGGCGVWGESAVCIKCSTVCKAHWGFGYGGQGSGCAVKCVNIARL